MKLIEDPELEFADQAVEDKGGILEDLVPNVAVPQKFLGLMLAQHLSRGFFPTQDWNSIEFKPSVQLGYQRLGFNFNFPTSGEDPANTVDDSLQARTGEGRELSHVATLFSAKIFGQPCALGPPILKISFGARIYTLKADSMLANDHQGRAVRTPPVRRLPAKKGLNRTQAPEKGPCSISLEPVE